MQNGLLNPPFVSNMFIILVQEGRKCKGVQRSISGSADVDGQSWKINILDLLKLALKILPLGHKVHTKQL